MKINLTAADILIIAVFVILWVGFISWANEITYDDRIYLFNLKWNYMLGLRPIA